MKISKMQMTRRIVQILSFFLAGGMFVLALSGVQVIYTSVINHNFSLDKIHMYLGPLLFVLVLSILFRRFFCGWFCAFGALNDFLFMLRKIVIKRNFKIPKSADAMLKYLKYAILVFIIIFVWTLNLVSVDQLSPWNGYAQVGDIWSSGITIGIGMLLLTAVGAMFIERFFCRYLCPLGAILAISSKLRLTKIEKPSKNCNKCRLCSISCPMAIDLSQMDRVKSGECISCFKCINVCPKENARVGFILNKVNTVKYVVSVLMVFVMVNLFDKFILSSALDDTHLNTGKTTTSTQTASSGTTDSRHKIYKDGIYEGTARGYHPGLTVSVTIKNDKITDIQVISNNDDPGFRERPIEVVPQEIIAAQSTNVDAVSGATFTSRGIMNAVQAAFDKAKI